STSGRLGVPFPCPRGICQSPLPAPHARPREQAKRSNPSRQTFSSRAPRPLRLVSSPLHPLPCRRTLSSHASAPSPPPRAAGPLPSPRARAEMRLSRAAVASPWVRRRDGSQARIPSSASILHLSGRPVATVSSPFPRLRSSLTSDRTGPLISFSVRFSP
uniref:Uncharacterized protein n=1 Tax=Triticum urartu TaxID=4572 RepID=A0A8R7Q320_TRIUA